jgi:iron complex transport system substrate-binding protein
MRVVTLFPAATEIVAALGAADTLVGVSHECDYPPSVTALPRVTTTPVDPTQPSGAIDHAVRSLRAAGRPVVAVDAALLRRLAPDLVITQGLCDVCAVEAGAVHRIAPGGPRILALEARDLAGVWSDIRAVAQALGRVEAGEALVASLERRLAALEAGWAARRSQAAGIPRVVCIEWLDPPYLAGHWVPELVRYAGGEDVGAEPGSRSLRRSWREIRAARPQLVLVMLCGLSVERAEQELRDLTDPEALVLFESTPTWILDGGSYTSRPGPRLVDGAERIRSAIEGREVAGLRRWVRAVPAA